MVLVGRVLRAVSVADQKYVFMRCYNAIWCDASAKAANAMCILTYIFYFALCVLLWTEQRQPMPMDEWKLSESQSCIRNLCVRWKVTFCRSVFILRRSACVVSWEFFCFVLAGGAANCAYRMNELRCLCPYLSPIDDEVFGRTRSASLSMQARLPPNNDTAIHVHRSLTRSILTQKSINFCYVPRMSVCCTPARPNRWRPTFSVIRRARSRSLCLFRWANNNFAQNAFSCIIHTRRYTTSVVNV